MLEGKGNNRGSVLMARCTCKGGQDGGCKHITACLYSLEDVLHNRGNVISGPCQWVKRATSAEIKPCEIKNLQMRRSDKRPSPSEVKRKYEHFYADNIDVDVRHENDRSPSPPKRLLLRLQMLFRPSAVNPVSFHYLKKFINRNPPKKPHQSSNLPSQ